ncbi:hypothetical protein RND71_028841 [Anisodus tanguticus]|uniref:Uncharacterized protein n=1 Tax=Anisodus tanguticus TaxID=243964 RepID=A0AAE1RKE3_9SOLA|nr:hypothetical protein RND71_028841 [Anisodus tanguticus]
MEFDGSISKMGQGRFNILESEAEIIVGFADTLRALRDNEGVQDERVSVQTTGEMNGGPDPYAQEESLSLIDEEPLRFKRKKVSDIEQPKKKDGPRERKYIPQTTPRTRQSRKAAKATLEYALKASKEKGSRRTRTRSQTMRSRLVDEDIVVDDDVVEDEVEKSPLVRKNSKKKKYEKRKSIEKDVTEGEGDKSKKRTPSVYEAEVVEFNANICYTDDCTLVLSVNETNFELDELKLGEILEVPTDGIKSVARKAFEAFMNVIVKRDGSATRARLFKKELKLEYQLLFVLVNKVMLLRALQD